MSQVSSLPSRRASTSLRCFKDPKRGGRCRSGFGRVARSCAYPIISPSVTAVALRTARSAAASLRTRRSLSSRSEPPGSRSSLRPTRSRGPVQPPLDRRAARRDSRFVRSSHRPAGSRVRPPRRCAPAAGRPPEQRARSSSADATASAGSRNRNITPSPTHLTTSPR